MKWARSTIIETLSGELKAARDANDTLREQVATAQAESAALKKAGPRGT